MATPGAPSPDPLSDAPPRPPGPQGSRGDRGGARLEEDGENRPAIGPRRAAVKSAWRLAGGARDVTERRGDARGAYKGRAPPRSRRESRAERLDGGFAVVAAASASHRLFRCPSGDQRPFFLPRASGPYSPLHEIVRGHFRSALWACESAHPHAAPGAPAPADGAGPTPRLGVPLPQREIGRREPERRGPSGLPGRTLAAHTPAERPRNAPGLQISAEQRVTSNPTRTLVDLGAAPYNRSRCCSHAFRETTHSEGQCRWWRVDYYTRRPKAESLLSQGPRPVFVKTLDTLSICAQTHLPKFLETSLDKVKERYHRS